MNNALKLLKNLLTQDECAPIVGLIGIILTGIGLATVLIKYLGNSGILITSGLVMIGLAFLLDDWRLYGR